MWGKKSEIVKNVVGINNLEIGKNIKKVGYSGQKD